MSDATGTTIVELAAPSSLSFPFHEAQISHSPF